MVNGIVDTLGVAEKVPEEAGKLGRSTIVIKDPFWLFYISSKVLLLGCAYRSYHTSTFPSSLTYPYCLEPECSRSP